MVVAVVQFVRPGPINGWKGNDGFDCPRLPGESDDELLARVEAEARERVIPEPWGIVLYSY